MSSVVPGVVNHRGARTPASGMVPLPFGSATIWRLVPCVFARVVTAANGSLWALTRTKEGGGGTTATPPSLRPIWGLGWL
jgi:hypothetical protein